MRPPAAEICAAGKWHPAPTVVNAVLGPDAPDRGDQTLLEQRVDGRGGRSR